MAIYDGTNKLANATVTGLQWSYDLTRALVDGSHTLRAVIQPSADTSLSTGRVIAAHSITVDTTVPAHIVSVTGASESTATNGSVTGSLASGTSTDGTLPTITGTTNLALTAGQVLTVYDSVNGATAVALGNATVPSGVNGNLWSYVVTTALAVGTHDFTARVVNTATGVGSAYSLTPFRVIEQTIATTTIIDNTGSGSVDLIAASRTTTTDTTPTLSGTLGTTLGTGEVVAVYDLFDGVSSRIGTVTPASTTWSITPTALAEGTHTFYAVVQGTGGTLQTSARVSTTGTTLYIDATAPTVTAFNGVAGSYKLGDTIALSATMSETVLAGSSVTVTLNTGRTVTLTATTAGTQLTGTYTVAAGDSQASLGIGSFQVGTGAGTTLDRASNALTSNTLPSTGLANISVDGTAPALTFSDGTALRQLSAGASLVGSGKPGLVAVDAASIITDNLTPVGISKVQFDLSGFLNGANEALRIGTTSFAANGSGAASTITVSGMTWNVSYTSGSYRFVVSSGAATAAQTAALLNFTYLNGASSVTDGTRTVRISVFDSVGNGSTPIQVEVLNDLTFPTATVAITALGSDTGTAGDFITTEASQSVFGTYAGNLSRSDRIQVSTNGTTWIDATTISPTTWQASGVTLSSGTNNLQVRVTDTAGNANAAVTRSYTLESSPITATAAVTGASEATAGLGTVTGSFASGTSTDGTAPILSGTLTGTLTGSQVVAIYDTFNGVMSRLGTVATPGATWTYSPGTLSAGNHVYTARVENVASGNLGTMQSGGFSVIEQTLSVTDVRDDVGAIQGSLLATPGRSAQYIMVQFNLPSANWQTINEVLVYSGGTNVALGKTVTTGPQGEFATQGAANLVDGSIPTSATSGVGTLATGWFQIDLGAAYLVDSIVVHAPDPARATNTLVFTSLSSMAAPGVAFTQAQGLAGENGAALAGLVAPANVPMSDPSSLSLSSTYTDDGTPTLSGQLAAPLGAGEVVAIYDMTTQTKLGETTPSGTTWSFTPSAATPLSAGGHLLKAVIQLSSDTSPSTARVSSSPIAFVVDAGTASRTVTISSVTDAQPTNGSSTGTLTGGASTDATTPTLTGTIVGGALTGAMVVGVYDIINGVSTRLGTATVSGSSWTFNPPALATGSHTLSVRVENSATGVGGTATTFNLIEQGISNTTLTDDAGSIQGILVGTTARYIRVYHSNSYETVSLTGMKVYSNSRDIAAGLPAQIGTDTGVNLNTTHNNPMALTDASLGGSYNGTANPATSNLVTSISAAGTKPYIELDLGSLVSIDSLVLWGRDGAPWDSNDLRIFFSATPFASSTTAYATLSASTTTRVDVAVVDTTMNGAGTPVIVYPNTDDNRPTISGTLAAALGSGEEIAVYDLVSGTSTKVTGTVTLNGLQWTFTPTAALADGAHSFRAVVQATGNSAIASGRVITEHHGFFVDTSTAPAHTVTIASYTDASAINGSATGTFLTSSSTDATTPTINGSVNLALTNAQSVVVYDTLNGTLTRLGVATMVTSTTWTFTPTTRSPQARTTSRHASRTRRRAVWATSRRRC